MADEDDKSLFRTIGMIIGFCILGLIVFLVYPTLRSINFSEALNNVVSLTQSERTVRLEDREWILSWYSPSPNIRERVISANRNPDYDNIPARVLALNDRHFDFVARYGPDQMINFTWDRINQYGYWSQNNPADSGTWRMVEISPNEFGGLITTMNHIDIVQRLTLRLKQ